MVVAGLIARLWALLPPRPLVTVITAAFAVAHTHAAAAQDARPQDPNPVANDDQLLKKYVQDTLGLEGAIHASLMSGWAQWRQSPSEWHRDGGGYARRWTSDYASSAIGDTTKYAVARLF